MDRASTSAAGMRPTTPARKPFLANWRRSSAGRRCSSTSSQTFRSNSADRGGSRIGTISKATASGDICVGCSSGTSLG